MTKNIELIAVANPTANQDSWILKALTEVIISHETLTLEGTSDQFVHFSGSAASIAKIVDQFGERVLFEDNKALTLDVPGPHAHSDVQDQPITDLNDIKDESEIKEF